MAVRLLKQALKGGFAKRPPAALLDGLLAPYSTEVGKLSLIRNAAALNTNLTTEIAPLLPSIRVPTLILWGEDDVFQPVAYGERLAWDIPGAKTCANQRRPPFCNGRSPAPCRRAAQRVCLAAVTPRCSRDPRNM